MIEKGVCCPHQVILGAGAKACCVPAWLGVTGPQGGDWLPRSGLHPVTSCL